MVKRLNHVQPAKPMKSHQNTMSPHQWQGRSSHQAYNDAQQRRGGKGGTGAAGAQEARCHSWMGWTKTEGFSLPWNGECNFQSIKEKLFFWIEDACDMFTSRLSYKDAFI